MTRLLALWLFLLQGVPVQQGGTVTGVLRDNLGMPVPGIRVAAVMKSGIEEDAVGAAMSGIAETDELGRFTLTDIPPGRYTIAAGRLDQQTYYPGTDTPGDALVVTIAPGTVVSGINFVLGDESFGRAAVNQFGAPVLLGIAEIPIAVAGEGGGRFPLSENGKLVKVLVSAATAPSSNTATLDSAVITVPGPVTSDFRVSVVDLPDNWVVKSMKYGTTDITRGTFRLAPANFFNNPAAPQVPQGIPVTAAPPGPVIPPLTVSITLGRISSPIPTAGVSVAGRSSSTSRRLIYISGKPGTFFSDGTFEFAGVLPGRHVIITTSNGPSRAMAAIVGVGNQAIQNIELTEIPLIPIEARQLGPLPLGDLTPGTTIPLARVKISVVEEASGRPVSEGELIIKTEDFARSIQVEKPDQLESLHMLPGKYELTFQAFGHTVPSDTILVENKDINLELKPKKLF